MYGTDLNIQCTHPEWEKLEEHDQDTILLCKQFLHSSECSQAPLLMMPYSLVADKPVPEILINPRNKLPERSVHEFQKTAKALGSAPWELVKAQAYLEEWVANNIKSDPPASTLDLRFFKHYRTFPPTFRLNGIQHAGIQFPAPIQLCVVCGDASLGGCRGPPIYRTHPILSPNSQCLTAWAEMKVCYQPLIGPAETRLCYQCSRATGNLD